MFQVKILASAKMDINEAALWYNKKQSGLGLKFTNEIKNKVKFIKSNPYASPIRYEKIHCSVLYVFPFMIHYTIDEAENLVLIVAVFHTSRNPNNPHIEKL